MNHTLNTSAFSRTCLAKPVTCAFLVALCAAFTGLNASAATRPLIHAAPASVSPRQAAGQCLVDISTIAYTPALAPDGSGGNVLFSGSEPNENACHQQALTQWSNALTTGWSPANRCLIIHATRPSDEILTEITYSWNGGPTIRSEGYGSMCSPHVKVSAPNY